jgi:hypothetical protein
MRAPSRVICLPTEVSEDEDELHCDFSPPASDEPCGTIRERCGSCESERIMPS